MSDEHDIIGELGLDRSAIATLSRWELAALAREILDFIEVPPRGPERNRLLVAKEAVTEARDFYD